METRHVFCLLCKIMALYRLLRSQWKFLSTIYDLNCLSSNLEG